MRAAAARADEVIRIDAAFFALEPLDMRAGTDKALARVVDVFGEARAHHAYLFVNKRCNRNEGAGARGLWSVVVRAKTVRRKLHPRRRET